MRAGYFNVAPRFTPGSPALVNQEIALRVAAQERRAFEPAKMGVYGKDDQERAGRLGLRGIVEYRTERGSGKKHGWEIIDVCTGEKFFRLTDEALRKNGWTHYADLNSGLQKLIDADQILICDLPDHRRAHYKFDGYLGSPHIKVYRPELLNSNIWPWPALRPEGVA